MAPSSTLTSEQRYAAAALLALALRRTQFLGQPGGATAEDAGDDEDDDSFDRRLWTHESHGLLRPVFRFLEIDPKAWHGLEETAASSPANHHVEAFLRMVSEEGNESSSERSEQELALMKAVDSMAMSLDTIVSDEANAGKDEQQECHFESTSNAAKDEQQECHFKSTSNMVLKDSVLSRREEFDRYSLCADIPVSHQRKVAVLLELLSACVAYAVQDDKGSSHLSRGYDARHRTALRLLATWLDVEWIKMEAMEVMVACSAMTAIKEKEAQSEETESEDAWCKWKRGGIIGAAALTGGTLMAITGGLAAPAIAAGFSALAPTLGTLVPVIGASGFAAAASAAGSVAGSVAVAASFGAAGAGLSGSKMARRIADVEEFEFKPIGENHNQGRLAVGILISGFVVDEEDFIKPWEGTEDNLERYVLQWESKNLIAVSTAIQDWLTSRLTTELMKQGAMMTVLSTLVSALAWPTTLLAATDFIDSKWSIAIDRSDKSGKLLAEVLLKELQGNRPVTLVGFSLGARVIFKCLQHLAESRDNEGLVERVVLLGAPISLKGEDWESARKMVAGRFVNVFSANDWILGVTFHASLLSQGLAGIQAVDVPGIENVDVTHLVDGHSSYLWAVQEIMQQLQLDSYYPVFLSAPVPSE